LGQAVASEAVNEEAVNEEAVNEEAVTTGTPEIPVDELELRLRPLTRSELKIEADGWIGVLQNKVREVSTIEIASKFKKAGLSEAKVVKDALKNIEDARQVLATTPDDKEATEKLAKAKQAFHEVLEEAKAQLKKSGEDREVKQAAEEVIQEAEKVEKEKAAEKTKKTAEAEKPAEAAEKTETLEGEVTKAEAVEPEQDKEVAAIRKKIADFEDQEAEERGHLLEKLTKLRAQQTAFTDRVTTVVNAYEKKGGPAEEIEEYRQYITAVSGIKVDVSDVDAVWTTLTGWLMSEEGGLRWARNIVLFIVTVLVFVVIANMVSKALKRVLASTRQASRLLSDFMVITVRRLILAIGFIVGLAAMEVNIGPLLAVIGAAGFVIAFALQNSLGNFASGILILVFRPFDVGDMIEVSGILGTVKSMNLLSIQILTPDNKLVVIANNQVWGDAITNVTGTSTRRVDLVFGIAYEDDIEQAQRIMEDVVSSHERVLKRPETVIRVHELGDSSVNFVCRPWVKTEDYWDVYWDLTEQVKQRFDKEGISIPYPQRDVHMIAATAETPA
jgi:small conductance mechanosensitive channel